MSGGGQPFDENQKWNRVALLVCVTSDNHNKYYRMYDDGNLIHIVRGRVGSSTVYEKPLPSSRWDSQLGKKLKKYRDVTHLHAQETQRGTDFARVKDARVGLIVDALRRFAGASVKENYTATVSQVTQTQLNEAQQILDGLANIGNVDYFNERLVDLWNVIPRKMHRVQDFLLIQAGKIHELLEREQEILDTMAAEVSTSAAQQENDDESRTVLDAMNLTMRPAQENELALIRRLMGSEWYRFRNAYAVENLRTGKNHDEWIARQANPDVLELWHGSSNGNWWSIMTQGLNIRPASTNGSMFGRGLYFANNADKSIGYTSASGSRWAKGSSSSAYLALFSVHVGKRWHPGDAFRSMTYQRLQSEHKADSVHALAGKCRSRYGGGWLRSDEIIVYKEAQASIKFIVEIGG